MGHVEASLVTVQAQITNLNKRFLRAESSWVTQVDRMNAFDEKISAMQRSTATNPGRAVDELFHKLAVVGFDPQISIEHKLVAMNSFMESTFPTVDARYSVVHSSFWQEKGGAS